MFNKICKTVCPFILSLLLVFSVGLAAFAAEPDVDFGRTGSVSLTLRSGAEGHEAIPNGNFTLYKVAAAESVNGNMSYSFTEEFKDCGLSLADLKDPVLAGHLAAYAKENNASGTAKTADGSGRVVFDSLPVGLYLIAQNGGVPGWYPVNPFLVSVPMTNAEGTGWVYDLDASPKAETWRPEEYTQLSVNKVWQGYSGSQPNSVTVNLLRDGEIYENLILNAENEWKHTWEKLDKRYSWSVVETNVPSGYTVSYSEAGQSVTITNTADTPATPTPAPGDPPLIQTGQLNWPVPVLAGLGLVLLLAGWLLLSEKGKERS